MGWAGNAYKYGILAAHWYWIGAIPAMLFLALVMMPFYHICRTHSVPGYLKLRFGESSRTLASISFAFMTVLMSGINMYAMAVVMRVVLGWDIHVSIWISSITVAIYVALGGLRSAIFNEVLQFFLIWAGALLIPILGLVETGGWNNLKAQILQNLTEQHVANAGAYTHLWSTLGDFGNNPMGINWVGIVFGLGAVISMGYWTTDFLVIQRVLSAKDLRSAKLAPIIGAAFKMMVPFIVILPGLLGLALLRDPHTGNLLRLVPGDLAWSDAGRLQGLHSYDEVLPLMLARYCGPGLLGLGITALIAGFMSGMAGNVSAFATVWTYDIYGALINKKASDDAKVKMGRWCTLLGVAVSIGTAYLVMHAQSIMDYVQALFSFFIAPLFGTVLIGMLWKRATPAGGFLGPVCRHCIFDRHVHMGKARSRRGEIRSAIDAGAGSGSEHVPRAVVLPDLCRGHGHSQPGHEAQTRCRIDRPGLRADGRSARRARLGIPPASFLGGDCGRCVCHSADYFLVRRNNESWRFLVHMVLHRRVHVGKRRFDHWSRRVGACLSCGQSSAIPESSRQHLVGRAVTDLRRGLLFPLFTGAGTGAECR